MRTGWISAAALTPRSVGQRPQGRLERLLAASRRVRVSASRRASSSSSSRGLQELAARRLVVGESSREVGPQLLGELHERAGAQCCSATAGGEERRAPACSPSPAARRTGARVSTSSATGSFQRYCPFIQSSFSGSKTAAALLTRSSEKAATSSSRRDQLAVVARVTSRAGPGSCRAPRAGCPRRGTPRRRWRRCACDRRCLSGPRISGRWPKRGSVAAERLEQPDVLRRVGEVVLAAEHVGRSPCRCRRPTTERWYVGLPSERSRTKSSSASGGELDVAAHEVVKRDRLVRHAEADGERLAGGAARLDLLRRAVRRQVRG